MLLRFSLFHFRIKYVKLISLKQGSGCGEWRLMKIGKVFKAVLILLSFGAVALGAPVQRIHEIQRPLFSVPAIVRAGESFTLEIRLPEGLTLVEAFLDGIDDPGTRIPLKTAQTGEENGITVYSATVPADAPEALYDLSARFDGYTWDRQPHSVKVVKEFKTEFDFVQLTDIHFNVQHIKGQDMRRIRQRLLLDINRQNPEFVAFSGDLGLDPETYDRDYAGGYEMLADWLRVPIFMVPGNHEQYYTKLEDGREIDGRDYWTANYGPTWHSFDYGGVHFVGLNNFDWPQRWRGRREKEPIFFGTVINAVIGPEQWEWLKADLEAAHKLGRPTIAYAHIPIEMFMGGRKIGYPPKQVKVPGPNTDEFAKLLADNGCDYIFVGHMHYNQENKFGGLTEEITKAAGIGGENSNTWAYRVIHVKDGKIAGMTMHEVGFKDL